MARTPQYTATKKKAFLDAYANSCSVTKAAKSAQIDRNTHYDWLRDDPDYVDAFNRVEPIAARVLEQEAVRRAYEGVEKPVYQGGKRVGYVQEYSDTLLIFLLKGALPDKYKERGVTEHTGPKGAPLFDFSRHSADELAELARTLRAASRGSGTTETGAKPN